MKIWIVTIYEPLPFGDIRTRPQRCGMLAKALINRGHSVELWTSDFDHASHKHIHKRSLFEKIGDRISIQFIKGCGYSNDLSPKRLFHNRQTGKEFIRLANSRDELPDIIFTTVPALELAQAVVRFANQQKIPVIVDLRDLWPEVYLTMIPKLLHPIGKALLHTEYERAKFIFKNVTGITAVSKAYLQKGLAYAQRSLRDTDNFFPLGSSGIIVKPDIIESYKSTGYTVQKYGIDQNQFIITFIGTFSKFLDIENILQASKLLMDKQNIRLFIVGDGQYGDKFFKMGRSLPNVTMTGWLNSEDIQEILAMTKVGLAAYSKDAIMSLPNKPFEYMAAGLPLLSSLKGELERLIREHDIGRCYKAGDPSSLAEGICWFYDHPKETRQMSERSASLFLTKYKSEIVYEEFSKYLEDIVEYNGKQY